MGVGYMSKDKINSGTKFMNSLGIGFIVLGIIAFVLMVVSFDYVHYIDYAVGEEKMYMQSELLTTWFYGLSALVINIAIGTFFIAVDKISVTLKKIQLGIKD